MNQFPVVLDKYEMLVGFIEVMATLNRMESVDPAIAAMSEEITTKT